MKTPPFNQRGMGFRSSQRINSAYHYAANAPFGNDNYISAVLFSAMAVEAFVNDLTAILRIKRNTGDDQLDVLADMLPQLETDRAQITTKVQFIHYILAGKRIDHGSEPYQSFALLVDLRNRLIHVQPPMFHFPVMTGTGSSFGAEATPTDKEFVAKLIAVGAGDQRHLEVGADWSAITWNSQCAAWALHTSLSIIKHLVDQIKKDYYREMFTRSLRLKEFLSLIEKTSKKNNQ